MANGNIGNSLSNGNSYFYLPSRKTSSNNICINDYLPKDLLLRIFSYLDVKSLCRCSQVSKYWHRLAFDGNNWKSIDLFEFQKDIKPHVVQKIAMNCQGFLRHLRLRGCQDITDETVNCFTDRCRLIEKLVLSECRFLTDVSCSYIGRRCHQITALFVDSCADISDIGMQKLVKFLPPGQMLLLRVLDISWCNVGDPGLQAIAERSPELQYLRCLGCSRLTSASVQCIAKHCPLLSVLNLNYCTEGITDVALIALAQGCNELTQLSVTGCSQITDKGLRALASGCPLLHTLEASRCMHLTDCGFTALARDCSMLRRLDLEECVLLTDVSIIAFANHTQQLDSLIVSYCDQITDDGICQLACSVAGRNHLRHLALDNCPNISDVSLDALGDHCQQLNKLDIFDCQRITRNGLKRLQMVNKQLMMQAYFTPLTPSDSEAGDRHRRCPCCNLL